MEHTSLIERIKKDDESALRELFYRHFNNLAAMGKRILGDEQHGKDVAQAVFIRFWEKRHELEVDGDALPYLKRMTFNEALASKRTAARKRDLRGNITVKSHQPAEGEQAAIAGQLKVDVRSAVEQLPDKCREVFKLSRYENMTYREIGEALNISPKTVENHMGRALQQLRGALREYLHIFF